MVYINNEQNNLSKRLGWLLADNKQKFEHLLALTKEDNYYNAIIAPLDIYPNICNIRYKIIGNSNGSYRPYIFADSASSKSYTGHIIKQYIQNNMPLCEFTLPASKGMAAAAHSWLHELVHFMQDRFGLLLIKPMKLYDEPPIMPDIYSAITSTLFCEAHAATEAIYASWRLQQQGKNIAWQGACKSPNWCKLSLFFQQQINDGNKPDQAAKKLFLYWYTTKLRCFYERRICKFYLRQFAKILQSSQINSAIDITPYLRKIEPSQLPLLLPEELRPKYLLPMDKITTKICSQISDKYVVRIIAKHSQLLNQHINPQFSEIIPASLIYHWQQQENISS